MDYHDKFFTLLVCEFLIAGLVWSNERDLYDKLMTNYSSKTRPVKSAKDTVNIRVGLDFVQLVDLDEKQQTLKTIVWIPQRWKDDYLVWPDDGDHEDLEYLVVRAADLWTPDIYVQNSLGNTDYTLDEFLVNGETAKIRPDGGIECAPAYLLQSWCTVDVRFYPFDTQECPIILSSWSYTESTMNFTVRGASIERIMHNSEWDVLRITYSTRLKKYDCCEDRYPEVHFTIHMKRKPSYYVVVLVAPLIMLHILSTFSFLVPPDSGERLSYGLTTFLALSVFSLTIGEKVPESSVSLPLVSVNQMLAMICNMISLLWSVAVIGLWDQNVSDTCCFRFIYSISRKVAPLLCIRLVCEERNCECDNDSAEGPTSLRSAQPDKPSHVAIKRLVSFRSTKSFRNAPKDWDNQRSAAEEPKPGDAFLSCQKERYAPSCRCKFVLRVIDKMLFILFLILMSLSELIFLVFIPLIS